MAHNWPKDPEQHLWTQWEYEKGLPLSTQYRKCVHPNCHEVQRRDTPREKMA